MLHKKEIYNQVANLHVKGLKKGFLPTLGVRFLSLLYQCIDDSSSSVLLVETREDKVIGFVSGTLGTSSLYLQMCRYPITLLRAIFPILLSFQKLTKIWNIVSHTYSGERDLYPSAELLTICVSADHQREGIAAKLYKKLCNYFVNRDITSFTIVVGESLDANYFYKKNGASIEGQLIIHDDQKSNVFVQIL